MRVPFWLVLLAALANPAAALARDFGFDVEDGTISKDRERAAEPQRALWRQCVLAQIRAGDDRVSTASQIAMRVETSCEPEYVAYLDALRLGDKARHAMVLSRLRLTQATAIPLVSRHRAEQNKAR